MSIKVTNIENIDLRSISAFNGNENKVVGSYYTPGISFEISETVKAKMAVTLKYFIQALRGQVNKYYSDLSIGEDTFADLLFIEMLTHLVYMLQEGIFTASTTVDTELFSEIVEKIKLLDNNIKIRGGEDSLNVTIE